MSLDTRIQITINNSWTYTTIARANLTPESINNSYWNIGERVEINASANPINKIITNASVDVIVIDVKSNSVVMMGRLQEAH